MNFFCCFNPQAINLTAMNNAKSLNYNNKDEKYKFLTKRFAIIHTREIKFCEKIRNVKLIAMETTKNEKIRRSSILKSIRHLLLI